MKLRLIVKSYRSSDWHRSRSFSNKIGRQTQASGGRSFFAQGVDLVFALAMKIGCFALEIARYLAFSYQVRNQLQCSLVRVSINSRGVLIEFPNQLGINKRMQ